MLPALRPCPGYSCSSAAAASGIPGTALRFDCRAALVALRPPPPLLLPSSTHLRATAGRQSHHHTLAPKYVRAVAATPVGSRTLRRLRAAAVARCATVARSDVTAHASGEVEEVPLPALPEGDRITDSYFCHGLTISQLERGYRYCADDVLCAHLALEAEPKASRLLDLGSGVGTIGLIWLAQQRYRRQRRLEPQLRDGVDASEEVASMNAAASETDDREPHVTFFEAQSVSVALCRRTLRAGGLEHCADVRHGDLRNQEDLDALGGGFDMVTLNPPYMSETIGALPKHPQRAYCRHELRGDVLDFCRAAAGQLAAKHGRLCIIHSASRERDVREALKLCNVVIQRFVVVTFRGLRKSVAFVCGQQPEGQTAEQADPFEEEIEVQLEDGAWSPGYVALCRNLGF